MAKLIITENGRDKIYEITDEEVTIGSSAEADVQVHGAEAAPIHVTVKRTPKGYQVVDMETKTGTVINGRPANAHVLGNGDTIQIGTAKITYIGKGPARAPVAATAGARPARARAERSAPAGTDKRSHYRRDTWDSKLGGGGMAVIAISALVIFAFVAWMVLKKSDTPEKGTFLEIKNARVALERERSPESLKEAQAVLAKYERKDLEQMEQTHYDELKKLATETKDIFAGTAHAAAADDAIKELRHHEKMRPNDVAGLEKLASAFLKEHPGSKYESEVEAALEKAKNDSTMTPERRKLAELEKQVDELVWGQPVKSAREFRKAYDLVLDADVGVRAVHEAELQAIQDKLLNFSNRALRVRKNDVRHMLREGKPAEARAAMREMLDKLVTESFVMYLRAPEGGYENPETSRLELETQKLMREELERYQK